MQPKPMARWIAVLLLLAIALSFGSNNVSARLAFEHGTSVTTAVTVRSIVTALAMFILIRVQRVPLALPGGTRVRAMSIGVLLAAQSFCLYSAVARIPVALALLAFNTFPMLLSLISWATGGEAPTRRTLVAMPIALIGLAMALDVLGLGGSVAGRLAAIGAGVGWALGAALAWALILHLTVRWLKDIDARVRTLLTLSVAAAIVLAGGLAGGGFALPDAPAGWLGLALLCVFYGTAITLLFAVLPRVGAVNNAVVLSFEPIVVLALAWVFLGQAVAARQIAGAFVVVGAIVYLNSAKH